MKDKPILDACCGGKMFYFDKHNPNVLFQDIRKVETTLCDGRKFEVKPDVQADFTNMPYPDNSFRMVVFDPPHLLRKVGKSKMADMYGNLNEKATPTGYQHIKYGALYSDWRDMLAKGFKECFRRGIRHNIQSIRHRCQGDNQYNARADRYRCRG